MEAELGAEQDPELRDQDEDEAETHTDDTAAAEEDALRRRGRQ